MLWNSSDLHNATDRVLFSFAGKVASQQASNINFHISNILQDLTLFGKSLFLSGRDQAAKNIEFIYQQTEELGFDSLIILNRTDPSKDFYTDTSLPDFRTLPSIQQSLEGEPSIAVGENQSVIYSVPLYQDEKIMAVVAGVRSKSNIQSLIQPENFEGYGLTCITNQKGEVIISPTDLKPFFYLDTLFVGSSDPQVSQSILQMKENMANQKSGAFFFSAADGSELILAYNPLDTMDWVLLTLISADLIFQEADRFIAQTSLIMLSAVLLFFVILISLRYFYQAHNKQLARLAFVDPVTEGMNISAFHLQCQKAFHTAPPNSLSIVCLNISNFKLINESFGRAEGDHMLRYMMRTLESCIQKGEFAARSAADTFFLCLKQAQPEQIRQRIARMTQQVNSFPKEKKDFSILLRAGVYILKKPETDATVATDRARTACQNVRPEEGSFLAFYDTAFMEQILKEYEINSLFEPSLQNGDFQIYLQPKVRLSTGRAAGAEALVRWIHPQKGMLFPDEFIPLFERNGKIRKLDLFVFEQVCSTLARWAQSGMGWFPVAVNLSRRHFHNPDFLADFYAIAQRYQIPSGIIEMEMTESIFFDDESIHFVKKTVQEMHRLGFLCSLDDFGSGYSSLGLLQNFDVDTIKLDRRFFQDLSVQKSRDVVECMISLSQKLDIETVAEGIETDEQLDFLRSIHCDLIQGYIFSKPLPVPEFEAWLHQNLK